jgi:hypothetical protein
VLRASCVFCAELFQQRFFSKFASSLCNASVIRSTSAPHFRHFLNNCVLKQHELCLCDFFIKNSSIFLSTLFQKALTLSKTNQKMAQYYVHDAATDDEELESLDDVSTDDFDDSFEHEEEEDSATDEVGDDDNNDEQLEVEHDDNDNESLADYEVDVDTEYEEEYEENEEDEEDEEEEEAEDEEYEEEEEDEEDEDQQQEYEEQVDSSGVQPQPQRMLLAAKHRGGGLQTAALRTRPSSEVLSQDEARRSGTAGRTSNDTTTETTKMPQNGRLVLQPRNSSRNNGGPSSRRYQAATSRINSAAASNDNDNSLPDSKVSNLEPNGIYDDGYNVYRSYKRKVPGPNTDRGILNSQVMFDRVFHPDNGKGRPPGPGLVPAKPIPPPNIPNPRAAVELERKRYAENNPVKMSMDGIQPKGAGKLVLERPVGYHGYQPVAHDIPFMPQKGAAVNRRVPTSKPNYTASVTVPQNRDFEHTMVNNNDPLPISSGLMQRKGLAPMATSLQHWRVNGTLPVVAAEAVARSDEAAGSYSAPLVVQGRRANSGSIKNTSLLAGVKAVDDPSTAASKFSWNPATETRASNSAPEAKQTSGSSSGAAGRTVLSDRAGKRDVAVSVERQQQHHLLTWNTAVDGPGAAPELRDTVRYAEPRQNSETGFQSAAASSSSSSSSGQMSGPHNPNALRYTAPRTQTEAEAATAAGYGLEAPAGSVSGPRSSALRFVAPRAQSETAAAAELAQQTNGTSWHVSGTELHEQPRLHNVLGNVAPRQSAGINNNTFSGTGFSGSLWATNQEGGKGGGDGGAAVMQLVKPRHTDAPRYFEPRLYDEDGRLGGVARLATGGLATTNIQQFAPKHDPATRYLPPRPEQRNAPASFVKSSTSASAAAAVPSRRGPENVVQFTEPRSQAQTVAASANEQWTTSGAWVMAPRAPDATRYVEPRNAGPDGTLGNAFAAKAAAGASGRDKIIRFVEQHNPNAVRFTQADQPTLQNRGGGNVVPLLAGPTGTWVQSAALVASSAALKNAETRTLQAPASTFDTKFIGPVVRAAAADSVAVPTVRDDVLDVPGRFEVATRSELGAHQQDAPDVLLPPQLSSLPAPKSATTQRAPTSAAPAAAWTASQVSARNAKMDLVSSRSAFRTVGSSQVPASVSKQARARDQAAALASNTRNTPLNVPAATASSTGTSAAVQSETPSTLVRPRSSTPRVPAHSRTWRAVTNDRA